MRLPSSSSLLLASLTVSSSLSSLSALAAPAGDGSESSPNPVPKISVPQHAPIPYSGHHDMIGRPQTRNFVDAPELGKAIPGVIHAIMDALMGKGASKGEEGPLAIVEHLVPAGGKRTWAEEADGIVEHAASEDSRMQPFASQPGASTPTAGRQDAPVVPLNPPAGCPSHPSPQSGLVRRQGAQGEGQGGVSPIHFPPRPPSRPPSPLPSQGTGSSAGAPGQNVGGGGG